jgi:hypothetical protein
VKATMAQDKASGTTSRRAYDAFGRLELFQLHGVQFGKYRTLTIKIISKMLVSLGLCA